MFALIDCKTFYASCEQLFRPELRGRPVVVLTNNDGAIAARSKEAKDLGVPDMQPYFKVRELLQRNNVVVFSSNYVLYGDISSRVVRTVQRFAAEIEVYSCDELFARPVQCFGNLQNYGALIRDAVKKEVGIPVDVGIAPTKTLSKLCNRAAKKIPALQQVCVLENEKQREWLLRRAAVGDIWGVGTRLTARLTSMGIMTGWDLANANSKRIRRSFNVNLERTVAELNGVSCLPLEEVPSPKQQIFCSRSFGEKTNNFDVVAQALASYASRVTEKLRHQKCFARTIHVFVQSSPYANYPVYRSATVKMPFPTNDSRIIIGHAVRALKSIFVEGVDYQKTGIGIIEIESRDAIQVDMFTEGQSRLSSAVMATMDSINSKFGRGTLKLAAEGFEKKWDMRQTFKSPAYTTRWSELPKIKC